jgi:hypothetical protein
VSDWRTLAEREEARFRDGADRLPDDPETRQRQLTRMANAAYGAGLAHLMDGDEVHAAAAFAEAARTYRASYEHAPPDSWGRTIGAMKARVLADDWAGAEEDARWTLGDGAAEARSPIGRYGATLALLVLGRDADARALADALRTEHEFPQAVGDALAYLAGDDPVGYDEAINAVLESFETRDKYLEDVPVADTVLVLQALARRRNIEVALESSLLP